MCIAIPIWEDRVSPVFDTASRLLLVDLNATGEAARRVEPIDAAFLPRRSALLVELGVETLLCGAISRPLMALVSGAGIRVFPFLGGRVDEVLEAFRSGQLDEGAFRMPGCRGCGLGLGPGHGRGRGRGKGGPGRGRCS